MVKKQQKQSSEEVFHRFSKSPGFNVKHTLGSYASLPPPPPRPQVEHYSFHEADSASNIQLSEELVDGRPQIKAGTLEKLVQRLTHEEYLDTPFLQAFLLTYRTFTSSNQLLNMLRARYFMKPPSNAPKDWSTVQKPIRLRVFNALKNWLLKGFYDFEDNPKLRKNFLHFLDEMAVEMGNASQSLRKVFDRQMNEVRGGRDIVFSKKPPVPILPRSLTAKPTLVDLDAIEVARQLTVIESELYRAIKPWEFLNQSWAKKDKEKRAPRVLAMIDRFNQVSNWVSTIILREKDAKARVHLLRHIIAICHACLSLNNFNAVMEIISGLQASAIFRLKLTWSQIDSKSHKMLEECQSVMSRDQNFKNFRAYLHSVDPPCIPYLGMYLTDLTFIEDGNSDNVEGGLINFVKRQQVSGVINEIQQYQYTPYCLEKVEFISDWLWDIEALDEEECYKLSVELEPRGLKIPENKRKITISRQGSLRFGKSSINSRTPLPRDGEGAKDPYGEMELVKGYLFYDKDSPNNIVLMDVDADDGPSTASVVTGGTVVKLVERLTHERPPDMDFLNTFLMTFRTFTTSNELLDLLINRFHMPQPKAPTKEQAKNFRNEKLIPIRFRVFNVLKEWTNRYSVDFKDTVLVERILDFATKAKAETSTLLPAAKGVIDTLQNPVPAPKEPAPLLIGSKQALKQRPFLEQDFAELSSQIYAYVAGCYINIEPREYLTAAWDTTDGRVQCPHLYRITSHCEVFRRWIQTELFRAPDVKTRSAVLAGLIQMAERFLKLSDHLDAWVIVDTLKPLLDRELQLAWEWLPPRFHTIWWSRLQDQNQERKKMPVVARGRSMTTMRAATSVQVPNLLPELQKIQELHQLPDLIEDTELINFEKRLAIYTVYSPIAAPPVVHDLLDIYNVNEDVHKYLRGVKVLSDAQLKETMANMNNERPEGIPPSQQEKNELIKKTEMSIDDSIKPFLIKLIQRDPSLKQSLVQHLNHQIRDDAVQQMKLEMAKFAKTGKLLLSLVLARQKQAHQEVHRMKMEIARTQFPESSVDSWTKTDTTRSVFGWQAEISLVIAQTEGERTIVEAFYYAKKHDVSTLLRMLEFYQEENEDIPTICSLVVMGIDDSAMEIAMAKNINVIKL